LQNLAGQIWGLTLSNNAGDATNDLDVTAGEAVSDDALIANRRLMTGTALTKRTDAAWSVGTNQGCWDTGSVANGMVHVFAILRTDTNVTDILCSASTSPLLPISYTKKRRIASIPRTSGAMVGFYQDGDYFGLKIPSIDYNVTNPGTSAVTPQLSVASGAAVTSIISFITSVGAFGEGDALITSPYQNNNTPSVTMSNHHMQTNSLDTTVHEILTNTSGQIRFRLDYSDGSTIVRITSHGWRDQRGRHQ
jgi:hypothetical protein